MYEDFKNKSYWKNSNKIRTLWYIFRRLLGGALVGGDKYANILERLSKLELSIDNLLYRVKQYLPGNKETKYDYQTDWTIDVPTEEEEFLPDLIITNISRNLYSNYALFSIVVKNEGDAIAGSNTLQGAITGEDEYSLDIDVPELGIGESTTLYYTFPYYELGNAEVYSLLATVDVYNIIEEKEEGNNTYNLDFNGKQTYEEADPPSAGSGYLIYHIHNPEGKEINSITGVGLSAYLYINGFGGPLYGAHNTATHTSPVEIPDGTYLVDCHFNGLEINRWVTITDGQTTVETFTFTRTEVTDQIADNRSYQHNYEVDGDGSEHSNFDYFFGDEPYGVYRTRYEGVGTYWHTYGTFTQVLTEEGITIHMDGTCDVTGGSPSGQLEMGAHAYPWIGGSYLGWNLEVKLPAQSFDWWYCQHGNSSNFITIKGQTGYSSRFISKANLTGYHIDTTWAGNLISGFPVTDGDNENFVATPNAGISNWESTGTIEDFHISSIPYDLDGNAVKG